MLKRNAAALSLAILGLSPMARADDAAALRLKGGFGEGAGSAGHELVARKEADDPLVVGEHEGIFGRRTEPLAEGVGLKAGNDLRVGELHRPLLRGEGACLRCDGGRGDGEAGAAAAA